METVKVLGKGQIVIPAAIRKKYGIHPGSHVHIFDYGNIVYLMPPAEDPVADSMGCLPPTPSMSEEILEGRKKDFAQ